MSIAYTGVVPEGEEEVGKTTYSDAEFVSLNKRLAPDVLTRQDYPISDAEWFRFAKLGDIEDSKLDSAGKARIIEEMKAKFQTVDDLTADEWIVI